MPPFFEQDPITLYCGDLREVLPTLPEATVDFVVTDPPYGLSFMEKEWDHEVPGPEYWRAIGRVCKPGALLLAFGGTRTYHRLTCAIEDAGWEIRDCLMWLYGQGFPKSADIGKLIDKAKGAEREVIGDKLDRPGYHLHEGKGNGCYGGGKGLHAPGTDARLKAAQITAPATPEAARWTGWAMALKPAWEPIVLAMKPMGGTIADNALAWGVAGMNIDACRLDTPPRTTHADGNHVGNRSGATSYRIGEEGYAFPGASGRYPANLLLDEESAAQLDAQTGTLTSGKMKAGQKRNASKGEGGYHGDFPDEATATDTYGDSGGASRFFHQVETSEQSGRWPANVLLDEDSAAMLDEQTGPLSITGKRSEHSRNATVKATAWGTNNHKSREYPGDSGGASRFFYCGKATKRERGPGNDHPTVKPVKLMRYLLTLLSSPDGGVILDPFAGSGSTLVAAQKLGRRCIGIELTEHNCEIARNRLQ